MRNGELVAHGSEIHSKVEPFLRSLGIEEYELRYHREKNSVDVVTPFRVATINIDGLGNEAYEQEVAALITTNGIDKLIKELEAIVCTEGEDKGVILVDSHSHVDHAMIDGQHAAVYRNPYFSDLGEALIKLHKSMIEMRDDSHEDGD